MPYSSKLRHSLAIVTFTALLLYWSQADHFDNELIAEIAVFAILAMSLDLVAGTAGMVSLGHAALFGSGAYMYALLSVVWGWPAGLAMPAASLATGVLAFIVAVVATRVQGIFFIMITLAIGEMAHEFFFKNKLLGGDDGFGDIPRIAFDTKGLGMSIDLQDPSTFALAVLLVVIVIYLLLIRLLASPYGALLHGLHDNAPRLRALGLPARAYQCSVFALSGLLAGLAGTLSAQHTGYISPQLLDWTTSGEVLVMIIVGGLGTVIGSVIGAATLVLLRHELSDVTRYWGFWLGLFLILVVVGGRNGIVGWLAWGWERLTSRLKDTDHNAAR
jgi:branched-chain amino acid transport system permease protein